MPALTLSPSGTVAIRPNLLRRFYEPIVFLCTLIAVIPGDKAPDPADPSSGLTLSLKEAFQCYVYKLAQVCDNERGGTTITSFAVLREPDKILYVFASNDMTPQQLENTKGFVTSILTDLQRAFTSGNFDTSLTKTIRRDILRFNKPRLDHYIHQFAAKLSKCLPRCTNEDPREPGNQLDEPNASSDASQGSNSPIDQGSASEADQPAAVPLRRVLERLQNLCSFIHPSDEDEDQHIEQFLDSCERLLAYIDRVDKSPIRKAIEQKASEGLIDSSECWHHLRHFAGRLVSMYNAVDYLVSAPQTWKTLFQEDFEVLALPSSKPAKQPLDRKGRTAAEIIGRMTSDGGIAAAAKEHAETLEQHEFNAALLKRCTRPSLRPLVHSEVLLADWLQRNGGLRSTRFFNGWNYIGCSKPTCRLCQYYFQCWPGVGGGGGVQVRPSHRNVYTNWRVPDVTEDQGPQAPRAREKVLNGILERVRKDVFHMLEEREPDRKRFDSNTSSRLPKQEPPADSGLSALLASQFGSLSLGQSRREAAVSVVEASLAGSDDEDEGGGASLA